jgi:chemotaxis protein MotB
VGRLHEEHEGEKDNAERWLLTYSDVITLLLALFIILYGMSSLDAQKLKDVSQSFQGALHNEGGTPPEGLAGAVTVSSPNTALGRAYDALHQFILESPVADQVDLRSTSALVNLTLGENAVFHPNSADFVPDFLPIKEELARILWNVAQDESIKGIVLVGHTADLGTYTAESLRAHLHLSFLRALAFYEVLVRQGVNPALLRVECAGPFKPIADNGTEAGRAQNRRVEIIIT